MKQKKRQEERSTMTILFVVIVLIILGVYIVIANNKLVRYKQEIETAESQIDVQLERRADLIPNLVSTVKGYAKYESETLSKVTEMRQGMVAPTSTLSEKLEANDSMTSALRQLMVSVEAYPELRANENFIRLQEELTNTENKVAYTRMNFNNTVGTYNFLVESFPSAIIASMFGFKVKDRLKALEEKKVVHKVEF